MMAARKGCLEIVKMAVEVYTIKRRLKKTIHKY